MPCKFLILTSLLWILPHQAWSQQLMVGNFSQGDVSNWERKKFANETFYLITEVEKKRVLKATSKNSATAFYKNIKVDLDKTPYLNWSWRVDNIYNGTNPRKKSGDDYPARIYVVLSGGFMPWRTLALNYVFSNNGEPLRSHWASPFTRNSHMVVMESGFENLKKLKKFKVNVKKDFEKYFGKKIDTIDGVAIMSDSDNAHSSSQAYFGDIFFSSN